MNKIYKTVWNTLRGQLVCVNEASAGQGKTSRSTGSEVKSAGLVKSAVAVAVMSAFVVPSAMAAAGDVTIDQNFDASGYEANWNDVTITNGATLTANKSEMFDTDGDGTPDVEMSTKINANNVTVDGTVTGEAVWNVKTLTTNATGNVQVGDLNITEGQGLAVEVVNNKGTTIIGTLKMSGSTVNNTGSLTVQKDVTIDGKLISAGTVLSLKNVNLTGELANTATSGTQVANLDVGATGKVTGAAGVLSVTGTMGVAEGASVEQSKIAVTGAMTNAGTVTIVELDADSTATNTGALTVSGENGANVVGKFTNSGTAKITKTLVADVFEQTAGSTTADKLTVAGALNANGGNVTATTGATANSANVAAGKLTVGAEGLGVTTALTTVAGAELDASAGAVTADTVANAGTLKAGTMEVATKMDLTAGSVTTTGLAEINAFKQSASTTSDFAQAQFKGASSNAGDMKVGTMTAREGTFTNTGTLAVTTMNVEGGTITNNNATADAVTVGNVTVTSGAFNGSGALKVTGETKVANGGTFTQATVNANTLDVDGSFAVGTNLTTTGTADFKANATGTVKAATMGADMTHAGNMVFTTLTSDHEIDNTAGVLQIGTLTGASTLLNKVGAEVKLPTGATAQLAVLDNAGTLSGNGLNATTSITNSGSLTATAVSTVDYTQTAGTSTVQGMTMTGGLNVTGGTVESSGTVSALTGNVAAGVGLTVTGTNSNFNFTQSLANAGTITTAGTATINNLTQTGADAALNVAKATLTGTGSLEGTLTASDKLVFNGAFTGNGTIDAKSSLTVNESVVLSGGTIKAVGQTELAAGKTLEAANFELASTEIAGTLTTTGTSTIGILGLKAGAVLNNSGTLDVTDVGLLKSVTYNQTGNGVITFADDSDWFSQSEINLQAGSVDRGSNGLGFSNVYNVSNSSRGDLTSPSAGWMDGFTILAVDTLTTESTVNLLQGGLLEASQLALSGVGSEKTLNLKGGAIESSLDQFFQGVKSDAIDMEAIDVATGRIEITGGVIGLTSVGDFNTGINNFVGLESGDIVFYDDSITVDLVNIVNNKIATLAGENASNVQVHYTGSTDKVFTIDVANSIIDKNADVAAIFDNSTLFSRTDADEAGIALVIGTGTNAIKDSIGFANVALTDTVTVQDGKQFALIGKQDTNYTSLVGENGGTVTATGEGSKFTLGTLGRAEMTGSVATAIAQSGGTVFAKGGDYKITDMKALADGIFEVASTGKAQVTNLLVDAAGTLNNAGTLTVNALTDAVGATSTNTGGMTVATATEIKGGLTNKTGGLLTFTDALTITGSVTNEALQPAVTQADTSNLTQGMVVGAVEVAAQSGLLNKGTFVSLGQNVISGGVANTGNATSDYTFRNNAGAVADLSAGKTTIGSAAVTLADGEATPVAVVANAGELKLGEVEIGYNSRLNNYTAGVVEGTKLTMDSLAKVQNFGTMKFDEVVGSGLFANTGTLELGTLEITEGADAQLMGYSMIDNLVIGEGATVTSAGQAQPMMRMARMARAVTPATQTLVDTLTNNAVYNVETGAEVLVKNIDVFGEVLVKGGSLTVGGDIFNPTKGGATVYADKQIAIGSGKLAVGAAAADQTLGAGDAWFGADSTFVIDTAKIAQGGTLTGEGKLTAVEGATLAVGNIGVAGKYQVAQFDGQGTVTDYADVLGWYNSLGEQMAEGRDYLFAFDGNGGLFLEIGKLVEDDTNGDGTIDENDKPVIDTSASANLGGLAIGTLADAAQDDKGASSKVSDFMYQTIASGKSEAEVVDTLNMASNILGAGAFATENLMLVENVADMTERHLSYGDVHFANGQLQRWEGVRIWGDALGQTGSFSDIDFAGSSAEADFDNYGFIMGADIMAGQTTRFGFAFSAQKGDVDSTGSSVKTTNETDAYSVFAYAAHNIGQFNVMGHIGYTAASSDIEQTFSSGKHTVDADADIITAGIKGEFRIPVAENMAVVPYAGFRSVTVLSDKYTSKLGGQEAFTADVDTIQQFQMPIGVAFEGSTKTASGWTARGVADVSVTPVFGDKDATSTLSAMGLKGVDSVKTDIAGDYTAAVKFGVSAEKDNFTFGANVGYSTGDTRDNAVSFGVNARYRF